MGYRKEEQDFGKEWVDERLGAMTSKIVAGVKREIESAQESVFWLNLWRTVGAFALGIVCVIAATSLASTWIDATHPKPAPSAKGPPPASSAVPPAEHP